MRVLSRSLLQPFYSVVRNHHGIPPKPALTGPPIPNHVLWLYSGGLRKHDKIRTPAKHNEFIGSIALIKNGKFFLPPQHDGLDFKELFHSVASRGIGRPVDRDGFPEGPWTPDLLTAAICDIDSNEDGIDLRTVQLWFQNNNKGISADNIRWLARVLGCGDPVATSEWQMALSAAQARLAAKRRQNRKADVRADDRETSAILPDLPPEPSIDGASPARGFSLARLSERIFARSSPLDLPALIFAGAGALGFLSYLIGVHSATYLRSDGIEKQIGFLWAPNWTLLFMVFMPLFLAVVVELLAYWKEDARLVLAKSNSQSASQTAWLSRVVASSYTFWVVFLFCIAFAGVFQWVGVRLMPLLNGGGDYAVDWGSIALVRPDVISKFEAIGFTGMAYLYMCITFYLFYVGLILLYTVIYDLWKLAHISDHSCKQINSIAETVMRGVFRSTLLGILIAICMKLQSFYLTSHAENIVSWLTDDISKAFRAKQTGQGEIDFRKPTHYSSLLVAICSFVVFLYGFVRLASFHVCMKRMSAVVVLLAASYLLIGVFSGFSILLAIAVGVAILALFDPTLSFWRSTPQEDSPRVS